MPFRPCKEGLFKPVCQQEKSTRKETEPEGHGGRQALSGFHQAQNHRITQESDALGSAGSGPEGLIMSLICPLGSFGHDF